MVQDELTLGPSAEFYFLITLGTLGGLILLITIFYSMSDKGIWTGLIMIFFCLFGFDGQSKSAERAAITFMSDQKLELKGRVADLEIEVEIDVAGSSLGTTGTIKFDKIRRKPSIFSKSYKTITPIKTFPHGFTISRLTPGGYGKVWFKVGDKLVQSEVRTVGINLAHECDGRHCGLRTGDQVRVSVNKDRIDRRLQIDRRFHKAKFEDYYSKTLRIERCDDAPVVASSS